MAAKQLKVNATYDDLREVSEHLVAEMFDGELYASPRPGFPHARTAGVLLAKLDAGTFRAVAEHEGSVGVRAQPFDAVELELGALWTSGAGRCCRLIYAGAFWSSIVNLALARATQRSKAVRR